MSGFLEQFAEACKMPYHARIGGPLLRYVTQCDEKALQQVKESAAADSWSLHWLKDDLWKHLARPSELCEEEKRAMHAIVVLGQAGNLVRWLKGKFDNEPQDQDAYQNAYLAAFGSGTTARAHAAAWIE